MILTPAACLRCGHGQRWHSRRVVDGQGKEWREPAPCTHGRCPCPGYKPGPPLLRPHPAPGETHPRLHGSGG